MHRYHQVWHQTHHRLTATSCGVGGDTHIVYLIDPIPSHTQATKGSFAAVDFTIRVGTVRVEGSLPLRLPGQIDQMIAAEFLISW